MRFRAGEPGANGASVTLAGQPLDEVTMVDTTAGWAHVLARDPETGRVLIREGSRPQVRVRLVRGALGVTLTAEAQALRKMLSLPVPAAWCSGHPCTGVEMRAYILHGGPLDGRVEAVPHGRWYEVPVGAFPSSTGFHRYDLENPADATALIELPRCATCRWARVTVPDEDCAASLATQLPLTCMRTGIDSGLMGVVAPSPGRFAGYVDWSLCAPVGVTPDFGCVMYEAKP